MIYGRPVIQVLKSLDVFFGQLAPRTVQFPADSDWRARKLKEFIDQGQVRVRWRLEDTCKELGIPISDRQARRLFQDLRRGRNQRVLSELGVLPAPQNNCERQVCRSK